MTREGHMIYVHAVMTASVIYHRMGLDLDPWFLQEVDKLRCGFLSAPGGEASGRCCALGLELGLSD
jgi:hypothetical protein